MERLDNELVRLQLIHRGVKLLDKYCRSVCEMDFLFNSEKACFL